VNPVDPSKIYRLFYPAVPAIVSCRDRTLVYAMPVVSAISLSNDPPLVGVASSPEHATHKAILVVKSFSLSWLDSSQIRAIEVLGTTPQTGVDKLESAGLKHTRGKMLDVPIIDGAAASLECTLYARQRLGDHELLVAKVQAATASEDFRDYWRFESYEPVLYAGTRDGSFTPYKGGTRA